MEINIKNRRALERLLGQGIGYSLFTVSGEFGVQRIAIKKKMFKDEYILYYFSSAMSNAKNDKLNSSEDSISTTKVEIDLKDDGSIVIGGFAKFNIDDACFVLKNPSRRLLVDGQTFRKVDEVASKRTHFDDSVHYNELLEKKDEEIEQIKEESYRQKNHYTYGRLEEVISLRRSLIEIKERKQLSIKEYKYGREKREYVRTVNEEVEDSYKYGVSFIAELLKDKFKYRLSDNGMNLCDEIINIDKRIDSIYFGLRSKNNDNFDSKLSTISSLFGFIAADLKAIIFEICDSIRENELDTSLYEYKESGVKDSWNDNCTKYTHEIYWKSIDNLFDSIMEGSAVFIERVTGQDIREEIKKRLKKEETKQNVKK